MFVGYGESPTKEKTMNAEKTTILNSFCELVQQENIDKAVALMYHDYTYEYFKRKDRKKFFEYVKMNMENTELENAKNNFISDYNLKFLEITSKETPLGRSEGLPKLIDDKSMRFGYNLYYDKLGVEFPDYLNSVMFSDIVKVESLRTRCAEEILYIAKNFDKVPHALFNSTVFETLAARLCYSRHKFSREDSMLLLDFFTRESSIDAVVLIEIFKNNQEALLRLADYAIDLKYAHDKQLFKAFATQYNYECMERMMERGFSQVMNAIDVFITLGATYKKGGVTMVMKYGTKKFTESRIEKLKAEIEKIDRMIEWSSSFKDAPNFQSMKNLRDDLSEALEMDAKKAKKNSASNS